MAAFRLSPAPVPIREERLDMQSLLNQFIRTLFWAFVNIPIKVGRLVFGASRVGASVALENAPQEEEIVSPQSKQGRLDRANYQKILDHWEGVIADFEDLAGHATAVRAAGVAEERMEDAKETVQEKVQAIEAQEKGGIIYSLDRLEGRNTGLTELKRQRRRLQDRQDRAVEEILGVKAVY
jgi:hypothetical protein